MRNTYQSIKIKNYDSPVEKWAKGVSRWFTPTQKQTAVKPVKEYQAGKLRIQQ